MDISKIFIKMMLFFLELLIFIFIGLVIFEGCNKAYEFGYRIYSQGSMSNPPGKSVNVYVSKDMSKLEIAKTLKEEGLIEDEYLFYAQIYIFDYNKRIKAGEFELSTSYTPKELMQIMSGEELEDEETKTDS